MDMKKILQTLDRVDSKPTVVGVNDMKRFVSVIKEGQGPSNRLTQAESIAVYHSKPVARETVTSPVLNVAVGAKPSMIGKYFKTVEQEFVEGADRTKTRARHLAERVSSKLESANLKQQAAIAIAKKKQQGVAEGEKTMSRAAKGNEKYGKDGMRALAKAGRDGASEKKLDAIRDKHDNYNEGQEQYRYTDILEMARQGLSNEEIAEQLGFDLTEGLKDPKDNPCWKGYKPVGTKKKGGKTVPNCVPK
jgi:hypothetical protein